MRVVLDCRMASWTGVGRYSTGLTRALGARSDLEIVQIVARGEAAPVSTAEAVPAAEHPFSVAGARELGRILTAAHPDVTHCLHFPTPWPAHGPLVVTLHDLSPLLVPGLMPSPLRRAVYREMNRRAVRIADAIVCPSTHTARDVESRFGAARAKTRVTLEAADDFAAGPRVALTGDLARATASPYVFSMGSIRPHKDLPTLFAAFAQIAGRHPDLRLLLAGAGERGYIESVLGSAPRDVRDRIAFTGRVSDAELRTLYAGAAVFAFPSRYEGFGLPPLEAMALGAPVVVSDAASLPEVVGEAAQVVEPGDVAGFASAIERVLTDPAHRDTLIAAGHERAAQLTWATVAQATADVYREVAGAR